MQSTPVIAGTLSVLSRVCNNRRLFKSNIYKYFLMGILQLSALISEGSTRQELTVHCIIYFAFANSREDPVLFWRRRLHPLTTVAWHGLPVCSVSGRQESVPF